MSTASRAWKHGVKALLKSRGSHQLGQDRQDAQLGQPFTVRVEAIALTGHRFPAGFSQERTTYIQLRCHRRQRVKLYQSGYVVDKPHAETGEMSPDGNMADEDLEHVHAVVDPGITIGLPTLPYPAGQRQPATQTRYSNWTRRRSGLSSLCRLQRGAGAVPQ